MTEETHLVALVPQELKTRFQAVLLRKYGHISNKMSPTIREIVEEWIERESKRLDEQGIRQELRKRDRGDQIEPGQK